MGEDGAAGLLAIRDAGGITMAQSQDTCVVYGMPHAAVVNGAANDVRALDAMAAEIEALSGYTRKA